MRPKSPPVVRLLAPALLLGAGAVFLAAPRLAGDQAAALVEQAMTLKRAGKLDAAAVAFRQAIELDPASLQGHWGLAWVRSGQGKKSEASAEFRRVLELAPQGEMADQARAALARLGAPPPKPPSPPPLPPPEAPLAAARHFLATGEAFEALRRLRSIPADDLDYPEAQTLIAQAKQGRRKVRLRAVADQVLRSTPGWEQRLRTRFAFAAAQIGRQVEIDLVLTDLKPWRRERSMTDGLDLVDELSGEFPLDDVEAVVAFVAEERTPDLTNGRPEVRGYTLGLSPCFAGYGLVAEVLASQGGRQLRIPEAVLRENLVHELGHLFGAVHVKERSVMRPSPAEEAVYDFDPPNLQVMQTARWVDFRTHFASFSDTELTRLEDLYGQLEAGAASDDGVHFYRALVCQQLKQYDEAIREYEAVLKTSPQDPYTHFNLAELYARMKRMELAQAHWKIVAAIGRPATLAALAEKALEAHRTPGGG